jgi:type IV secretory pathway VirB4 component
MTNYKFPIADCVENELISMDGDRSFFYELKGIDLEQLDEIEISNLFALIEKRLNNLKHEEWVKLYQLNGGRYLNTSLEDSSLGLEVGPVIEPLHIFFEGRDIYSDIGIYDDYLLFNGKYRRVISIKSFPEEEIDEYFLPKDVNYCISFKKKQNSKALKDLDKIRSAHSTGLSKNKRDFESEGAYSQAEDLISDLTSGNESLFEMELYFLPTALSLEDLNSKTQVLLEELTTKGMIPFVEGHSIRGLKSGLFQIYKEIIVGVKPSFKYWGIPNKTGHIKYLLPIHKSNLMNKGIEFLDIADNDIFLNPFSKTFKSRNMLVTGATGGGKSVLVNKIVHTLAPKHPVVILDKGGSFKKLCLYHGGYNLESGINPMDFKCPYYLREFILSVVDKEKFKKLEKGLLLKEIKVFMNEADNSFFKLIEHLESHFKGLSLYFEDIKDFISESTKETNKFLYVDIENFPKTQIAPLIIYILEYFKNIDQGEKVLVFDECWSFLKDHGDYIDECFRTFRKSGAFPIAISQGLGDFSSLSADLYSSITNNSFFKVFFPQEYIEDKDISEFDNSRISSLQYEKGKYSECYLKTQDNKIKKILRIFLTPLELELFHTEYGRSQNLYKFFEDHKDYFSTNKETINAFVRLHHETV